MTAVCRKGKCVGRFLDFFFLPANVARKRKRNGLNMFFTKNLEIIFPYLRLKLFQKEKNARNRQDIQLKCPLLHLFFSFLGVDRWQKEKMDHLTFSINY